MSWNECLYQYHRRYGGSFLGGEVSDGLLILSWKDRPLAVDLNQLSGRYGTSNYVRARIPVTLAKPYKLIIGAEKLTSSGLNTVLKAVPALPKASILPADFGYPEVTKKRSIRSDNHAFTKLVLGSLEFRNALAASPKEKIEVRPGPGNEGLHLLTVTTSDTPDTGGSDWYLWTDVLDNNAEQRVAAEFFPRLDRFLDLARTAYGAVTQWGM